MKNVGHCWWWERSSATAGGADCLTCGVLSCTPPHSHHHQSYLQLILKEPSLRHIWPANATCENIFSMLFDILPKQVWEKYNQTTKLCQMIAYHELYLLSVTYWPYPSIVWATLIEFELFAPLYLWRDTMVRFSSSLFQCNADMLSSVACQQARAYQHCMGWALLYTRNLWPLLARFALIKGLSSSLAPTIK